MTQLLLLKLQWAWLWGAQALSLAVLQVLYLLHFVMRCKCAVFLHTTTELSQQGVIARRAGVHGMFPFLNDGNTWYNGSDILFTSDSFGSTYGYGCLIAAYLVHSPGVPALTVRVFSSHCTLAGVVLVSSSLNGSSHRYLQLEQQNRS